MPSRQVDEHAIVWIKPPPGEFRSDPYDKVLTPSRRFGFELNPGKQAGSQREDGHEMADHSGQESRNVLRRYSVKTYQRLIHTPPIWEKTPIPNSQPGVAGTKSSPPIGSSAGDRAPAPSHTTGRTVFSIRRLESLEALSSLVKGLSFRFSPPLGLDLRPSGLTGSTLGPSVPGPRGLPPPRFRR